MRASTFLIVAVFSTACGQLETKYSGKSTTPHTHGGKREREPAPPGGLSFAIPPQEDEEDAAARFEVTIRGWRDCGHEAGYEPFGDDELNLRSPASRSEEEFDNEDEEDDEEEEDIENEESDGCGDLIFEGIESIFLSQSRVLNLEDLPSGHYDIEARLFDGNDQMIEEGYDNAYVWPGKTSHATVQLRSVTGNGMLKVTVQRAGREPAFEKTCGTD